MDQDYMKMYKLLDYCYDTLEKDAKKNMTKIGFSEYDYLALLLGEMSLDTFVGGLPADPAIHEEWNDISLKHSGALEKTIAFLTMYEDDFGCNFKITKQFLQTISNEQIHKILA